MKYCLIGAKLNYSYSALIHGRFGLDYSLKEIPEENLAGFVKTCEYDGFNVTIPYKKAIIPYLDGVFGDAEKTGAVNTVVKRNGKLFGYNTDIAGLKYAFERKGVTLKDKNVMILGGGGAAAVAQFVAESAGARRIDTVRRNGKLNYDNCYDLKDTEIIINATPVGTFPNVNETPIYPEKFPALLFVMDMTYNPSETELIRLAKLAGAKTSSGLSMLVKQAICSEEIWENLTLPETLSEDTVKWLCIKQSNLVLIGMPSSGKTALGKIIAAKLGKSFIDTDEEIFKTTGVLPENIIISDGEKAFRDKESAAIKNAATSFNSVIATGGGAILRPENMGFLSKNGVICYVMRDLSLLSTKSRPLSRDMGVEKLFEVRAPLYEKYCDFKVKNDGDINDTVKEIIRKYEDTCDKRA